MCCYSKHIEVSLSIFWFLLARLFYDDYAWLSVGNGICKIYVVICNRFVHSFPRVIIRKNRGQQNWYLFYEFYLITRRKFSVIHDFSSWLRTGSKPPDKNRFRSDTGKLFKYFFIFYITTLQLCLWVYVKSQIRTMI